MFQHVPPRLCPFAVSRHIHGIMAVLGVDLPPAPSSWALHPGSVSTDGVVDGGAATNKSHVAAIDADAVMGCLVEFRAQVWIIPQHESCTSILESNSVSQ